MIKDDTSLSEEDYIGIITLHNRFTGCRTWADLNGCLERYFHPLLDCESTAYGWSDPSIVKDVKVAGFAGLAMEDAEIIAKLTPYSKSINEKILASSRAVIACDVDVPRKDVCQELSLFYRDHPEYKCPAKAIYYSGESGKSLTTYMMSIDRSENGLALGVHRWAPNDRPFNLRDVRVMELVRPILLQTIRTIALSEELANYRSLAESLAEIPIGVALVRKDMYLAFINTAFREAIPLGPDYKLPPDLIVMVQREVEKRSQKTLETFSETPFYKLDKAAFRLSIDLVNQGESECYLLRLNPTNDLFSQISLRMQEANLCAREKEICFLAKDGFSDEEIAERLFISLHTVRTHMKNIHLKLDVQSRSKLVALLNGKD